MNNVIAINKAIEREEATTRVDRIKESVKRIHELIAELQQHQELKEKYRD